MTPLKALSRSVLRFVAIFRFRFFIPLDTLHQKYLITIKFQSTIYIEILGFAALLTEAVLGLPQLFRNCKRRSTKGMSLKMVLAWFVGDCAKFLYFVALEQPAQFWCCAILQICNSNNGSNKRRKKEDKKEVGSKKEKVMEQ
ncbi:unnamed protein product [Enterobius vermicularis]|uniref:G_PROTEIN_RECEP_F1_2 domain-containing protein n=1 Tax=Enterobius vermicularis TaxID=51028 RepID=A0A0N4V6V0_ENTVE|nr:unnamed protein product [Enterobius vermicularis]